MTKRADIRARLALLAGLGALALAASPAQAGWITTWSAAPVRPVVGGAPFLAAPSYKNQTLVQKLRIAAGGKALRVRLTNAYGEKPLEIGGARISLVDKAGQEVPGSAHMLTFAGKEAAAIAARAPLLSDTIVMTVPDLAKMKVENLRARRHRPVHLPPDRRRGHAGLARRQLARQGLHARAGSCRTDPSSRTSRWMPPRAPGTIAMMADSITDGVGASKGNDKRWPDQLADRLLKATPGKWGIANQGISGNRVISDGMGDSALSRIDRDIFALPGSNISSCSKA